VNAHHVLILSVPIPLYSTAYCKHLLNSPNRGPITTTTNYTDSKRLCNNANSTSAQEPHPRQVRKGHELVSCQQRGLTSPYGCIGGVPAAMRSGLMPCRCVMAFKCNTQPVSHCLIKRQEMQRWPALGKPHVHQIQLTHRSSVQRCWLPATTHYHLHRLNKPTPAAVVAPSCSDILAQTPEHIRTQHTHRSVSGPQIHSTQTIHTEGCLHNTYPKIVASNPNTFSVIPLPHPQVGLCPAHYQNLAIEKDKIDKQTTSCIVQEKQP
jgi:hypothetical protein